MIFMRHFLGTCMIGLSCTLAATCRADEPKATPSPLAQSMISLSVTSPNSDVTGFLKSPVSFTVKEASLLAVLDTALSGAGQPCPIESRQLKPMRLSFSAKGDKVGVILDAVAKAGGGSLYVFPNKLLLSPKHLLSAEEQQIGQPFSVAVTKATLPAGKSLDKQANGFDILKVMNTNISCSTDNVNVGGAIRAVQSALAANPDYDAGAGSLIEYYMPWDRMTPTPLSTNITLSADNVTLGEALHTVAQFAGCQLYLLPDKFLICSPNSLSPENQKVAVPAFTTPSINILPTSLKRS